MAQSPSDRFFGALNQGYDALLDVVDKANQRGYRFSRTALRQARRGEREAVRVTRAWLDQPGDVLGLAEELLDVQSRAQTRGLELTREWLGELGDAGREVRDSARRLVKANRQAGEAIVDGARDAVNGSVDWVRGREPAEAPSGRRAA
jgi:hypothetical protein